MSYSLLEMQETLRNIPIDGVKRVASGQHGKAHQLLAMDELKRRQEMSANAQAESAEAGVKAPPMIDQYMQMADMAMSIPAAPGGPPPGMMPGGPSSMPTQMPQGVAGLPGAMPQGPQPMAIPPRPPMPPGGPQVPMPPPRGYDNGGTVNPQKEALVQQLMAAGMSPDIAAIEADRMLGETPENSPAAVPARRVTRHTRPWLPGGPKVTGFELTNLPSIHQMGSTGAGPQLRADTGDGTPKALITVDATPTATPKSAPAAASVREIDIKKDFRLKPTKEVRDFMSSDDEPANKDAARESEGERENLFQRFVQYMQRPDSKQETGLKGIDLATIGLMIAGGDSPDPIQNIGRGGAEGLQMVQSREAQAKDMAMRKEDMALRRLSADRALEAQRGLERYRIASMGQRAMGAELGRLKALLSSIENQLKVEVEQNKRTQLEGERDNIKLQIEKLGAMPSVSSMVGSGPLYSPDPLANDFGSMGVLGQFGQ